MGSYFYFFNREDEVLNEIAEMKLEDAGWLLGFSIDGDRVET